MATQEINLVEVRIEQFRVGDRIYRKADGNAHPVFIGTVTESRQTEYNYLIGFAGDGHQGQRKMSRASISGMRRFYKSI